MKKIITAILICLLPVSAFAWTTGTLTVKGNSTFEGNATFDNIPSLPASDPTTDNQAARKAYVDAQVSLRKIGSFSHDLSSASGTQTITGVGFTPEMVMFSGSRGDDYFKLFNGYDDGTNRYSVFGYGNTLSTNTSNSLYLFDGISNYKIGYVFEFNSDGFVINWTKTNSPTGTMTIFYKASKE
ncbi:MAG: hypothetical protein C4540_04550 [Candidatus Omnitrophota bacterium]|nr:MAG: hypothetical protein C4540_04550 [Candidatus Omnitrophota bacterium]